MPLTHAVVPFGPGMHSSPLSGGGLSQDLFLVSVCSSVGLLQELQGDQLPSANERYA